jgi:ABC-2 type transport system ATP-binding protein
MPTPPAVEVSGLVKRYAGRAAVDGLDLVAPAGAVTALLGPNGAGKSTTVECCEGLRRPDGGTVRVLGRDPLADRRELAPRVGVMLQDGGLPAAVPTGRVLAHVAAMYAAPRSTRDLAATLGLDAVARTPVRRLSGGQRQRLALAVAVVGRPELAFLDEPTAGLDPQARHAVWDLVRGLRDAGTSVVLTTHQMADAEALADRVVVVDHGRTVAAGTVADIVGAPESVRVTVTGAPEPLGPLADALAAALAEVLGARPAVTAREPATLDVALAPDARVLHAVTGWAAERGLLVSVAPARRTLEDAFLDLTGRELR